MSRASCYEKKNVMRVIVGTSANQMLILTLLNTTSVMLANLSPGSSWRPCPVWCSGWEVVFVNAATTGRDLPSQHGHRLDHVWLTVGGKHHWGNTCSEKEDGRGRTDILCLALCVFCFLNLYLWYQLFLLLTWLIFLLLLLPLLLFVLLLALIQFIHIFTLH